MHLGLHNISSYVVLVLFLFLSLFAQLSYLVLLLQCTPYIITCFGYVTEPMTTALQIFNQALQLISVELIVFLSIRDLLAVRA